MPTFRYKAVTEAHKIVEGEMEAPSQADVVEWLRGLGQLPVEAREVPAGSRYLGSSKQVFTIRRASHRDVFLITHELATLLKAGVPLDRAFDTLIDVTGNERTRDLLRNILARIRDGASLADAVGEHPDVFPAYYASMVRAGEASGALDVVLARLAEFIEKSQALRESIKTALYYPIFLLSVTVLSLIILLTFVIPEFRPLFESAGKALPLSTRMLMAAGDFVRDYGWLILIGLVGAFYGAHLYFSTADGRRLWDRFCLRVPILGSLLTKIEVARFSRTASTLLHNGVGLLKALEIVHGTIKNTVIASSIDTVAARVKEGQGLAQPLLQTGVFPRLVVHLIRVGEETGKLDDMLTKLADIYDEEVSRTTARMLSLLVPVLTICMGVLIAAIMTSIITAIFSVNTLAF